MTRAAKALAGGALVWAMAVTAARTCRPPNDFAEAHWLLDYRFGFIRRGLAGAVLRELSAFGLALQTDTAIAAIAYVLFATLCLSLLAVAYRIAVRTGWHRHTILILTAFVTSPFIVTNAHLMGYLDHLVYLLAFAAIWAVLRGWRWTGASIVAASMFVHESALVVSVPLLALAAWATATPRRAWRVPAKAWLPLLLPLGVFVAIAVSEALADRQTLRTMLQLRLHRYTFVAGDMHVFVPEWLTTSFADNVAAQRGHFLERITDGAVVLPVIPTLHLVLFGAFAWMAPAMRRWGGAAVVAVVCAPLVLHLSAWDTARLWTYPIAAAFGALWIIVETFPAETPAALTLAPAVALPVLFANVVGRIPLLDGASERFTSPRLLALYAPAAVAGALFWVLASRPRGGNHV